MELFWVLRSSAEIERFLSDRITAFFETDFFNRIGQKRSPSGYRRGALRLLCGDHRCSMLVGADGRLPACSGEVLHHCVSLPSPYGTHLPTRSLEKQASWPIASRGESHVEVQLFQSDQIPGKKTCSGARSPAFGCSRATGHFLEIQGLP